MTTLFNEFSKFFLTLFFSSLTGVCICCVNASSIFCCKIVGFIGFSKYAVIILIIGSLFLNYLILLFSAKNNEIPENLLKIESCSIDESLLFKNYNEEIAYSQKEEAKEVNDIDFLNKLESISNISIPNQQTKK